MKLFKNRAFAALVLIAAIALSSAWGLSKAPKVEVPQGGAPLNENLSTAGFDWLIVDEADVLSNKTENTLSLYNANWDERYNSIVAFISEDSVSGDPEEYAYDLAADYGLGEGDALLLVIKDTDNFRFVWGAEFDSIMNGKALDSLGETMSTEDWEHDVSAFFGVMDTILKNQ